jgi:hypothetical protein
MLTISRYTKKVVRYDLKVELHIKISTIKFMFKGNKIEKNKEQNPGTPWRS